MSTAPEAPDHPAPRSTPPAPAEADPPAAAGPSKVPAQPPGEIGGTAGPEPTRYGDWENKGRCTDF